ncbi:carbamoyl-phosphate synthase large subunit [Sinorhizobium terangae]|uniref:ATP-grasp domain-containing protein n=1 Tax=Sinorhizobium terangae TaxID=110322 RepID=A0A6N7LF80_SINTE|nr:ATP-grasp domain-containing protein [Sinorhizobium terangae]MBB4186342.1 carbamoyl-phosphate synthase large subunit [Sinorhizobium terangae]MQX15950.1 ATP-grasp domain-containing protein [Sinorhizobium terangae]
MKVFITGAGALLGQGIIRALRRSTLKATIIVGDPSPLSAGLYWGDVAYLVPMAKDPEYLDRLGELLRAERPDILIPGTDVELPILAANREMIERAYGTKVIISSPHVVSIANDKWLTSEFLRERRLGFVPSCLPGDEETLIERCGFPLVVKPRVGARSIGFSVVRNREQLRQAIAEQPDIVIQKYVGSDATEYTAGTLTFDGKCRATIVMRRDLRDGNTYRAFAEPFPALNKAMAEAADALGAYGPANFQFRLDDGVPRVFEINARFSGTTAVRIHAGFNEVEMSIRHILFGEPVEQPDIMPVTILRHWSETVVRPGELITATGRLQEEV